MEFGETSVVFRAGYLEAVQPGFRDVVERTCSGGRTGEHRLERHERRP
jgi:hypothetical protein